MWSNVKVWFFRAVKAVMLFLVVSEVSYSDEIQHFTCEFKLDDAVFLNSIDDALRSMTINRNYTFFFNKEDSFEVETPVGANLYSKAKYHRGRGTIEDLNGKQFGAKLTSASVISGKQSIVFTYQNGGFPNVVRIFLDKDTKPVTWFDSDSGVAFVGNCS